MDNTNAQALVHQVGERLKTAREFKGLDFNEAADRCGVVTANYIRRLEKGQNTPTITVLAALCEAYDTTLANFLQGLKWPVLRKKAS